jgi:hypothetical protein
MTASRLWLGRRNQHHLERTLRVHAHHCRPLAAVVLFLCATDGARRKLTRVDLKRGGLARPVAVSSSRRYAKRSPQPQPTATNGSATETIVGKARFIRSSSNMAGRQCGDAGTSDAAAARVTRRRFTSGRILPRGSSERRVLPDSDVQGESSSFTFIRSSSLGTMCTCS